jgi:hypothetical protein
LRGERALGFRLGGGGVRRKEMNLTCGPHMSVSEREGESAGGVGLGRRGPCVGEERERERSWAEIGPTA